MSYLLRDKSQPVTRTAYLTMWGLVLVTLGFWRNGTDPVNIPKLLLLGAFSGLMLGNLVVARLYKDNKVVFNLVGFFVLALTIPLDFASAPLVQQIYGISGRNTGFLAYLFLAVLFLGAATLPRESDYQAFPRAILIAGYGSALVCVLELLGVNLLGALNVFGAIIGTLGNPNFVSAFSGIITVGSFALSLNSKFKLNQKLVFASLSLLSLFLVIKSKSFQGLGATFLGFFLVLLLFVFYKRIWIIFYGLIAAGVVGGSLIAAGLFEKGPLGDTVYQFTLPIRVQYWQAGLKMLFEHPLSGVGLNSYGDWYRFARDADALVTPGATVTTNVAHNVYIDFASNGGFLLLFAFSALFGATFYYSLKALRKLRNFDALLISCLGVWIVYLITAFFSIDQLGLAVWGWVIGGALIGISKNILGADETSDDKGKKISAIEKSKIIGRNATNALIPQLLLFLIFLGAVVPAFKGDLDWAQARKSGQAQVIAEQVVKWPQDEIRYSNAMLSFLKSGLEGQAVPLTLQGLQLFPRSSVLWNYLYLNPKTPIEQRNRAREKLLELDPLNPAVIDLKKIPG
jgi:O-antigen ligase